MTTTNLNEAGNNTLTARLGVPGTAFPIKPVREGNQNISSTVIRWEGGSIIQSRDDRIVIPLVDISWHSNGMGPILVTADAKFGVIATTGNGVSIKPYLTCVGNPDFSAESSFSWSASHQALSDQYQRTIRMVLSPLAISAVTPIPLFARTFTFFYTTGFARLEFASSSNFAATGRAPTGNVVTGADHYFRILNIAAANTDATIIFHP